MVIAAAPVNSDAAVSSDGSYNGDLPAPTY